MTRWDKLRWWAVYLSVIVASYAAIFQLGEMSGNNPLAIFPGIALIMIWTIPTNMTNALIRLRCDNLALRYGQFVITCCPFPEQRDECRAILTTRYGEARIAALGTDTLEREIAFLEGRLDQSEARVRYADLVLRAGERARRAGRLADAFALCSRPLRLDLNYEDGGAACYRACAECLRDMGRWEDGVQYAAHGLALFGSAPSAMAAACLRIQAECLAALGRSGEALQAVETMLGTHDTQIAPLDRLSALTLVALVSGAPEHREKMIAVLDPACAEGTLPAAFPLRGRLHLRQQRWDDARRDFLAAITYGDAESHALCLASLAEIAQAQGDAAEAARWYERLRAEAPESVSARPDSKTPPESAPGAEDAAD